MKPYLYPASIEFSIICATVFLIMWTRIGSSQHHHRSILASKNIDENAPYTPNPGLLIMLDCTKTSRGLFFGLLVFVCAILSVIVFTVYVNASDLSETATVLSQTTEIILLLIALILTLIAYFKVLKSYTKVVPQVNMFDVALEILSMFGLYAFCINSLIAIFYYYYEENNMILEAPLTTTSKSDQNMINYASAGENEHSEGPLHESIPPLIITSAILSIIQSTIQTFFILECLKRYAYNKRELIRKPARELITALLLVNVSLWCYDTFSSKRFDTNAIVVEHFGILKWSIINAFSSPLAIFYRFHSSVCLSDIWYGLYYG